jgi:hypothetical protein
MMIQNINPYKQQGQPSKVRPVKAGPNTPSFAQVLKDTYEPAKPQIREDLVNAIKKKIHLGYYNSQTVLDDLSSSFAKAMNASS